MLSITDPDILKETEVTDHEISEIGNIALEKLHRQKTLKEYVSSQLLD